MLKRLKIFLLLSGTVALAICALAGAALLFVDPNDYKQELADIIHRKVGRKVVFDGQLEVKLLPELRINTGAWHIENEPMFGGGNFMSVKRAAIELSPWALLFGKTEVRTIALYEPRLNLCKAADGTPNWTNSSPPPSIQPPTDVIPLEDSGPAAEDTAKSRGKSLNWQVSLFKVENAVITYNDLSRPGIEGQADYSVTLKKLEAHDFLPERDASFEMEVDANDALRQVSVGTRLKGYGRYNPSDSDFKLVLPQFFVQLNGARFTAAQNFSGRLEISNKAAPESGQAMVSLSSPNFDIDVKAAISAHEWKKDEQAGLLAILPDIKAEVTAYAAVRQLFEEIGRPVSLCGDKALSSVKCSYKISHANGIIDVSDIDLTLDETHITGQKHVQVSMADGKPRVKGSVTLRGTKLKIDDYLPADQGASADYALTDHAGEPMLTNLPGYDPSVLPELAAGTKAEAPNQEEAEEDKKPFSVADLDWLVEWLQIADVAVDWQMEELSFDGFAAQNAALKLSLNKDQIKLESLTFEALGGSASVSGNGKVDGKAMQGSFELSAKNIDMARLPHPESSSLQGRLNVEASLGSQSKTLQGLVGNLSGKGKLSASAIEYSTEHGQRGLLSLELLEVFPIFRALPDLDDFKRIASLDASFRVSKGIFSTRDTVIKSPQFNARGSGDFDASTLWLDYSLSIYTQDYKGIPINISGTAPDLNYRLDKEKALRLFGKKIITGGAGAGEQILRAIPLPQLPLP